MGLPFLGVGFLYEQGYFRQRLDHSGWQKATYPFLDPHEVALVHARNPAARGSIRIRLEERRSPAHLEVRVGRVPIY